MMDHGDWMAEPMVFGHGGIGWLELGFQGEEPEWEEEREMWMGEKKTTASGHKQPWFGWEVRMWENVRVWKKEKNFRESAWDLEGDLV